MESIASVASIVAVIFMIAFGTVLRMLLNTMKALDDCNVAMESAIESLRSAQEDRIALGDKCSHLNREAGKLEGRNAVLEADNAKLLKRIRECTSILCGKGDDNPADPLERLYAVKHTSPGAEVLRKLKG